MKVCAFYYSKAIYKYFVKEADMNSDQSNTSWISRNRQIKVFSISGSYGWMKLVIGEKRSNGQRFLRLKRYRNWFSIPNPVYFLAVQKMLLRGAKELKWNIVDSDKQISPINKASLVESSFSQKTEIPTEVTNFINKYPDFTKQLISINLQHKDLNYISEVLEIINNATEQSGERLKTALKELLTKISIQDPKGMQELTDLMGSMNLLQITSLTSIVKGRLDTIDSFEKLILDDNTYEINSDKSVHRLLEKSMWIIDENYWIVQSNKTLRTLIGDEIIKYDKDKANKRPDFACVNAANKLIIVEIKRPSIVLTKKELDQAEQYHLLIKRYSNQKYTSIEVYLLGNKISAEARELAELRKNVTLSTYGQVLEKCKIKYQDYLKILEQSK